MNTRTKSREKIKEYLGLIDYRGGAVDLPRLIEHLRIIHRDEILPDTVSGVLDCRDKNLTIILTNKIQSSNRKRFTLAHEIGHFTLHRISGVHMDNELFYRSEEEQPTNLRWEKEANQFAAELLMPEAHLKEEHRKILFSPKRESFLTELAKHFSVSEEAMYYRLKNL